jgi:hypothetical protein
MRVPDCLFPTDNHLEIPMLMFERHGTFVDLPVRGWGSVSRKSRMRGTWHFYVDDEKFTALWKHPDAVLKTKAYNCCEANYTTDDQMPMAVGIWRIYMKRWMARFWQSAGMNIFVDMNVAPKFAGINLLGVPDGWPSYSTSACDDQIDMLREQLDQATERACGNQLNFLVYGGGPLVRDFCSLCDLVNVPDARNASREVSDAQG